MRLYFHSRGRALAIGTRRRGRRNRAAVRGPGRWRNGAIGVRRRNRALLLLPLLGAPEQPGVILLAVKELLPFVRHGGRHPRRGGRGSHAR